MALVLGTNCGFVTVAPVADPSGTASNSDAYARAIKHVAPVGAAIVTEIGWWSDNYSVETNFEVGLYSHDAGNDKPLNRLYVDNTNAKGTAAGWKTVAVNWAITAGTTYWIAIQIDSHTGDTKIDYADVGAPSRASTVAAASLANPWAAGGFENAGYNFSIYAVYHVPVYSELSGTIAGVGAMSGNLSSDSISELSGTIAGVGAMSGNLGSVLVDISSNINYKRLVAAGSNGFYYEDI